MIMRGNESHQRTTRFYNVIVHFYNLLHIILCGVSTSCIAKTTVLNKDFYSGDAVLRLLMHNENIFEGTTFAHKVAETPFRSVGVEVGLRQALKTGTINHLFGTKTASLPSFGKCHLSEQTILNELASTELNEYFEHLFQLVTDYKGPGCGNDTDYSTCLRLSIKLSRYDLFHAHLVHNREADVGVLLFHSMEYPKVSKTFPYSLGYCQANSTEKYIASAYPFRNFLWVIPLTPPSDTAHPSTYNTYRGTANTTVDTSNTSVGSPNNFVGTYNTTVDHPSARHTHTGAVPTLWLLDGREPSLVWTSVLNPYNRVLYTAEADRLGVAVADVFSLDAFQTPMWYSFT